MFFGNKNTNNNSGPNVNTTFETWYSDLSSLRVGGWNNMISINFTPAIGKDSNGITQYDKEKRIITSLTQSNASTLLNAIKNDIMPKYEKGETGVSVSVSMGKSTSKNVLSVELKNDENNVPSFYLTFAQNVDENGVAADENIISYKFNKNEYVKNYDPRSGSGDHFTDEAEFSNFVNKLEGRGDLTGMVAHSIKYSDAILKRFSQNGNNQNAISNYGNFNSSFDIDGDAMPFN